MSSPKPKLKPKPQLPPRKLSSESLLYPPRQHANAITGTTGRNPSSHAPSSSISSFHSVSLSSDTDTSAPGSVTNFIATYPVDLDRTSTKKNHEADDISLTESYENVSTTSLASPATERMITLDWEKAMAKRKTVPPKLPKRPGSTKSPVTKPPAIQPPPPPPYPIRRVATSSHSSSSSLIVTPTLSTTATSSSSTFATNYTPRRVAPPPPPSRSSDRSSIASSATTYSFSSGSQSHQSHKSSLKTKRPTPVPLAARKRYEVVFNANIMQRRKAEESKLQKPLLNVAEVRSRRAVGWRGLSVDLLTTNDVAQQLNHENGSAINDMVGPNEKLEGPIVRQIWKRSGLHNSRLAEIW